MNRSLFTTALFVSAGTAFAQSGLDLDRAYASQLRADAETRASYLGANTNPGLNVSVLLQARYIANFRDERPAAPLGDNDTTLGFDIPRAQVRMSGAVTDSISGNLSFDFGAAETNGRNASGSATLLNAFAAWSVNESWALLIGQWHNPVVAEEAIEAEHTLAVDRSVVNEFFNPGYAQGVAAAYTSDQFKFVGAFSDGATYIGNGNAANSAFNSPAENDIGLTARFDWLFSGTWDQFADFTSWRGSNTGFKVGVGGHYQRQGDTNPSSGTWGVLGGVAYDEIDIWLWTIDAQYEGDGWNLFAGYVGHSIDVTPPSGSVPKLVNHGFVLQGGMFVNDQTELFARYEGLFLDSDLATLASTNEDNFHYLTAGLNYYFVPESHAAKFTADVVYSFSDTDTLDALAPTPGGFSGPATTGILGVSDGEFAVRGQLTLVF
ncbi:MAG: hypothetical protein D6692_09140 [Planctomycetota bacterium]|nr:MAG: hypothetical protein D6692_09140 [Planctomycetota bacterium]